MVGLERIVSISEVYGEGYGSYEGYVITTDKQEVELLLEGGQQCCEDTGYIMSEGDFSDYIGSILLDITLTNKGLDNKSVKHMVNEFNGHSGDNYGDIMFINIETSVGLLQFVAYNAHNGEYGHDVRIKSNQLSMVETL